MRGACSDLTATKSGNCSDRLVFGKFLATANATIRVARQRLLSDVATGSRTSKFLLKPAATVVIPHIVIPHVVLARDIILLVPREKRF